VVALFLVSAFGPPPSWLWAKTLAALCVVFLAWRLSRHLGLSVLLGMAAYALF
jgi:branched-subunit amino acid transport protein